MRKTEFPIVKLLRKPRILSFLTQILTFLRIVGNSAVRAAGAALLPLTKTPDINSEARVLMV